MNITLSKAEIEAILDALALVYYHPGVGYKQKEREMYMVYVRLSGQLGYSTIIERRYNIHALTQGRIVYRDSSALD